MSHLYAALLLTAVAVLSIVGMKKPEPGVLGTRAFGYGSLVLLSCALMIGPLSRLWPRKLSWLIPHRRAVGIWSAIAGVIHLLYVLQLVAHPVFGRTWLTLFLSSALHYDGEWHEVYRLRPLDNVTTLAWVGLIALLLLVLVALVSNRSSEGFLGHAAWKLIQQQAYTAMLFVSLHILIMRFGTKSKISPALLWWAPWLLLLVLLLQIAGFVATVAKTKRRAKPE